MPEDLDNSDTNDEANDSPVIRDLRKKADRVDAAEAKATELERKLALSEAGLTSLNEDQRNALIGAHKGDWSDIAEVRATAERLGWGPAPADASAPGSQIPADELAAHERVAAAAGGTPAPPVDLEAELAAIDPNDPQGEAKVTAILQKAALTA